MIIVMDVNQRDEVSVFKKRCFGQVGEMGVAKQFSVLLSLYALTINCSCIITYIVKTQ